MLPKTKTVLMMDNEYNIKKSLNMYCVCVFIHFEQHQTIPSISSRPGATRSYWSPALTSHKQCLVLLDYMLLGIIYIIQLRKISNYQPRFICRKSVH